MIEERPEDLPRIAAAVIVRHGNILLVRRQIPEGPLNWQFPAGKVEDDELDTDAAIREALEEVGLNVHPMRHLGGRIHPGNGRNIVYVACKVIDGTARVRNPDEIAEVAWTNRAGLQERIPYPLHVPVQKYLKDRLR